MPIKIKFHFDSTKACTVVPSYKTTKWKTKKKYGLGQKSLANLKIPQPKIARPKKARQQCLIFVDMFRIRRGFVLRRLREIELRRLRKLS